MDEDDEVPNAPAVGSNEPKDPKELSKAMYACAVASGHPSDKLWTQDDFLSLDVIPNKDMEKLLETVQLMLQQGLLKMLTKGTATVWRLVKREDAAKSVYLCLAQRLSS